MKIKKIEVNNFRALKKFSIDLDDDLSIIIGKNNTGKTSLLTIMEIFLSEAKTAFEFHDFNKEYVKRFYPLNNSSVISVEHPSPSIMRGFAFLQLFLYNLLMNILQQIFKEHFDNVVSSGITIRDTVFENVEKMLHCGDFDYGFAVYGCEHCGKLKIVPFHCKSRFCTTCGNLYSIRRSTAMSFKLIRCSHRHCVFTIPEELRLFFAGIGLCLIASSILFEMLF